MTDNRYEKAMKEKLRKKRDKGELTIRCSSHPKYAGIGATGRKWCPGCTMLRHIVINNIDVEINIKGDISHVKDSCT